MVKATVSLIGANGDQITLGTDYQTDYMLGPDVKGFGLPGVNVDIAEGAGDGGVWRRTRRQPRVLDLPILVFGNDRSDIQVKLRRLANIVSDRLGSTRVQVDFSDGTTVHLDGYLIDGGQQEYGKDTTQTFCRWVISLKCPDPYWTNDTAISFRVQQNLDTDGLLPYLGELRLTDGQGFGSVNVNNPGEVEAYPIWLLTGPFDGVVATRADGFSFTYSATVAAGTTVKVDTKAGTVTNSATGANLYQNLGTAPKLFSLPAGDSSLTVAVTNPTSATLIQCYFNPRHELVF